MFRFINDAERSIRSFYYDKECRNRREERKFKKVVQDRKNDTILGATEGNPGKKYKVLIRLPLSQGTE